MKKQLLAIAIGTAMAAPGAVLAEGPEVYGKINLSWDNVEPASGASSAPGSQHQQEINSHQSYLGVRGSSELFPMGMTGFYQLEYTITPNASAENTNQNSSVVRTFENRESFLGVDSDFGAVQVGRFNSPNANLGRRVDQFSDYTWGDISNIMRGQMRSSDFVQYSSPEFGRMVTFKIAGPTSEGINVNESGGGANTGLWDSFSSSLVFDLGGDIYAGLGFDHNIFQSRVGFDSNNVSQPDLETLEGGGNTNVDIFRFVAGADLDALEVGFLFQNAETVQENNLAGETQEGSEDTFVLSAGFMVTPDTKAIAQYADTSQDNLEDQDITQWTLGVDHRLGDRTKGYVYASNQEVDGDRAIGVFSLGAEHRF